MATVAKDAPQQLYRSVFAILTGDSDLTTLLEATLPEDPKIYQMYIDFDAGASLKNTLWITFGSVNDRPVDIEQMQDVRVITLAVNCYQRGPGSDLVEVVEKRVRELLDNADLSTATLFAWYSHSEGYTKTYESVSEVWHVTSLFHIMCMALSP